MCHMIWQVRWGQRKIDYEVQAFQDGKSIGKGVHSRFVVDAEKFLAKTYKK